MIASTSVCFCSCRAHTGNLDSKNTDLVFDIFKELSQVYGQSIVAVTHDDDFAQKSDRIVEMKDGRII